MESKRHGYSHKLAGVTILSSALCLGLLAFGQSRDTDSLTAAGGPDYDLNRHTVDGGGVMFSTGGHFVLSGTIGQPDAGCMVGDDFELKGGFWFEVPPTDCNDDGLVSLFDYETFTACLAGPGGGIGADPCPCFDVDRDGDTTLHDYAQLQAAFTGP